MLLASLAELFQPVGDGRPAAVGAEPLAVHEEIAVVCPEAVERLAGENPAVAPLRRLVEFLAPVAAIITVKKTRFAEEISNFSVCKCLNRYYFNH